MSRSRIAMVLALSGALLSLPTVANARGPATVNRLHLVSGAPNRVLAAWPGGLMLLTAAGEVHRIYKYEGIKGGSADRVRVDDLNGDGVDEVFGIGKPTFALDDDGDPLWDLPDGCSGFAIVNVQGDQKKELGCLSGGKVMAVTADMQPIWAMDFGRPKLFGLGTGDLDGDGHDEFEFEAKRYKGIWRISSEGEDLGAEFESREAEIQDTAAEYAEWMKRVLAGEVKFDVNGDGKDEESLEFAEGKVRVASEGAGKPLVEVAMPGGKLTAALVEDLDGDGKAEIVLGGVGHILIVRLDGKVTDLTVNPGAMKREPVYTLDNANATGLGVQDEEALTQLFREKFATVRDCYAKRLKAYSLVDRGKLILKFSISRQGKVGNRESLMEFAPDPALMKCIDGAAKRWKVPAAVQDDAHVILDATLGWTDSL